MPATQGKTQGKGDRETGRLASPSQLPLLRLLLTVGLGLPQFGPIGVDGLIIDAHLTGNQGRGTADGDSVSQKGHLFALPFFRIDILELVLGAEVDHRCSPGHSPRLV